MVLEGRLVELNFLLRAGLDEELAIGVAERAIAVERVNILMRARRNERGPGRAMAYCPATA
jgi:hypothetical protein